MTYRITAVLFTHNISIPVFEIRAKTADEAIAIAKRRLGKGFCRQAIITAEEAQRNPSLPRK